ncbi:MAG: hypothetical protein ABIQ93_14405 [Saprospiraceae bacterium]
MREAKNSGPAKVVRIALMGAMVLLASGLFYNCQSDTPATTTSGPNSKLPSAATPGSTSGQGTLRSADANTPQSLSGKAINAPQSIAEGQVVDEAGKGLPDVRVQCTNCQTSAALALSDESGFFKLPYHFEPSGNVQQMVIMVSKEKKSSKHIVLPTNTQRLKLELK